MRDKVDPLLPPPSLELAQRFRHIPSTFQLRKRLQLVPSLAGDQLQGSVSA